MAKVVRKGDPNSAGGRCLQGHSNIMVNGIAMGKKGSKVSAHPPCPKPAIHCSATAANPGSSTVFANGIRVILSTDKDSCGHSRYSGSNDVVVL
jgi:uncharacterized Zn-binding protein involved in type VI secretion